MKRPYYILLILFFFLFLTLSCICMEFIDVTENAGVNGAGIGNGVAFIDFDNDEDLDIYASSDPSDIFYQNNGDGTFTDITDNLGIKFQEDGIGVAFGDYDNDGDLDLYIPVNDGLDIFYQNEGGRFFTDITNRVRTNNPSRARGASFVDFDLDGWLDIFVVNENSPNVLYRNKDGKFFEDVTIRMGLSDVSPGRSCIWGDYDNDSDPDLYITNKGTTNKLYRNDLIGFKDITNIAGVGEPLESTGTTFADYDNDGNLDLFVGDNQKFYLYHNNGNGTFKNLADFAGVINPGRGCTPTLADFDNDGDLDLYLSVWDGRSLLYSNNGDGTFSDITEFAGIDAVGNAWSACVGDVDNDGDVDIYASFTTRNNILYENKGNNNNWLFIELAGSMSNTSGIGARVKVTANNITQMCEVMGGTGYGSQDSLMLEFGFGIAEKIDSVEVSWSSGIKTKMLNVKPNQIITIEEGFSAVEESASSNYNTSIISANKKITCLMQNYPNPFNPNTWIPFKMATSGNPKIYIYNSAGSLIRKLDLGYRLSGNYVDKSNCAFWDGKDETGESVSAGVYFYQLINDNISDIRKMILIK